MVLLLPIRHAGNKHEDGPPRPDLCTLGSVLPLELELERPAAPLREEGAQQSEVRAALPQRLGKDRKGQGKGRSAQHACTCTCEPWGVGCRQWLDLT